MASVRMSARWSRHLLTATFASLRCRELLDGAKPGEAAVELAVLEDALWQLQGAVLDIESQRELDRLVEQEEHCVVSSGPPLVTSLLGCETSGMAYVGGDAATLRILVTGASGNVGREVVRALLSSNASVVAADRGGGAVQGADSTVLDFYDRATWGPALGGVSHMFLMRPPAISDVGRTLVPFIDYARGRGVDHVVFLSVAGAGRNKIVPHRKVEDHLRARGDHHTNLRPGFFAQNLQSAYREDILEADRIYVPAGYAAVNWVDVRDVAEVAARVLVQPEAHRGQSYTLTGPGPVPWSDVTRALTAALGRPIRYEAASVLGYVQHLRRRGLPARAIGVQTVLHVLLRFGQGAACDPTLGRLLGRPPRGIDAYVAEHASLWARAGMP
jgi:uncharacterized protein YbjT (DUF2867 family)